MKSIIFLKFQYLGVIKKIRVKIGGEVGFGNLTQNVTVGEGGGV